MAIELPPDAQLMRALAEREAMLRALFDNPLCAIVVCDPDGHVRSASAAAVRMLGVELGDLLGQPLEALAKPTEVPGEVELTFDATEARARYHEDVLQDGLRIGVLAPIRP